MFKPKALFFMILFLVGGPQPVQAFGLLGGKKDFTPQLEKLQDHLAALVNNRGRKSGQPGNHDAIKYASDYFKSLGLQVHEQCFSPGLCNLMGLLEGEGPEYFLVGAHIDSVGHAQAGADDNASGVAVLLELARILTQEKSKHKYGVIFLALNGEESGLLGSKVFVREAKKDQSISRYKAFINLDMVGYNQTAQVEIHTENRYQPFFVPLMETFSTQTSLQSKIIRGSLRSDHIPFSQAGIPSAMIIEDWSDHNPCYHLACDTQEKINLNYMGEITLAVGEFVEALRGKD